MTDLTTTYLGLTLDHPIVASSSPLTGSIESLVALAEAGAAAVVLPSLFEEQIEHESMSMHHSLTLAAESNAEAYGGYFPELDHYNTGADEYLELLKRAKVELAIPVIASLNGVSDGGWTAYAAQLEGEGADAIELNIYLIAAYADATGADVENRYLELVESVRATVDIPLAIKLGPALSSPANMARRLAEAGADALVLFNRFYQPDIDLTTLEVTPNLVLSTPAEMRLVLRWVALLRDRVNLDLAATTGIHDAEGIVKMVLAGADVAMMASALLQHGTSYLRQVVDDTQSWFSSRDYLSISEARGSVSHQSVPDPEAFERANYMKTLISYSPGS